MRSVCVADVGVGLRWWYMRMPLVLKKNEERAAAAPATRRLNTGPRAAHLVCEENIRGGRRAVDGAVVLLRPPLEEENQPVDGPMVWGGSRGERAAGDLKGVCGLHARGSVRCCTAAAPARRLPRAACNPCGAAAACSLELLEQVLIKCIQLLDLGSVVVVVRKGWRRSELSATTSMHGTPQCMLVACLFHARTAKPPPATCTSLTPIFCISSVKTPGSLSIVVQVSFLPAMVGAGGLAGVAKEGR
jgi:hypothetical protein